MGSNSRHFEEGFMTFWFDKSFLQAMESKSQMFNKPSVIVLLHQSKIILVQTQKVQPLNT